MRLRNFHWRIEVFHDRTPFVGHKVYPGSANGLSSDLISPRVTSTVYYSWPVTKPWIFSLRSTLFLVAKAGVAFLRARVIFYALCRALSSPLSPPSPLPRPFSFIFILFLLPSLPLPYFFPFFLSSLNFKRTVTVPQEIVILIFLIFSFFTNPLHVYRLSINRVFVQTEIKIFISRGLDSKYISAKISSKN